MNSTILALPARLGRRLAQPRLALRLTLALATMAGQPLDAQDAGVPKHPMEIRYNIPVRMRDGVKISVDVFRPKDGVTHPAMLLQTPYNNDGDGVMDNAWSYVKRGYAYVTVDVRGRYDSEGTFKPYDLDGRDGSEVIDWIVKQPWSNGKVASHGASYSGKTQWMLAKENNPHHSAIVSYVAPADDFRDQTRYNGVPKLDLMYTWMMMMDGRVNQSRAGWDWGAAMRALPLVTLDRSVGREIAVWRESMRHDRFDSFWARRTMSGNYGRFDIPSFNVTGWYEGQLRGQVQNFAEAVKHSRRPQDHMLVIGPWLHSVNRDRVIGERDAGAQALIDLDRIRDEWLDHVMNGSARPRRDAVLYFLPVKNEWRGARAWPITGTRFTPYFLASGGGANTLDGNGTLSVRTASGAESDEFTYDPANPVPSITSRTAGARGGLPQGSVDNRKVEARQDVLVYTSEPFTEGVEVTGPMTGTIYLSTDVVDTDITLKVLDVYPDGRAHNIAEGIARAKYRTGYATPELMKPGQVYKVEVELFPTSNYFEAGHRVRIEVSSSDFPNFARNLNTANSDTTSAMKVARTRIHHSARYPSSVSLPVVPAGSSTLVVP
jgi:putative CocE/NonD family hydrolase